jgi:pimeloyl-ACP methyl ester carboxylesterase
VTYVLVPGAGGAAWYWHLVVDELRRRGHDAIAVDLPGDDDSAGLPEYTDAVVAAIGERTEITLVAQSMAGFTAPLVCASVPVSLIVLVNAMIPAPGETPGEWWTDTGQADARREMDVRDGRDPDAPFDAVTTFLHDVPEHVIDDADGQERRQSGTPFASPCTMAAWPDVPTTVLVGREDRFFPAGFQRRVAMERLGIAADEMPGGHLVALSHPAELADRLEAYRSALARR